METEQPSQKVLRDEYKLVFEGYKFFVSVRFIVAAFSVAMLFLFALAMIEWRTTSLFRTLLRRGSELESQLGLSGGFFHGPMKLP